MRWFFRAAAAALLLVTVLTATGCGTPVDPAASRTVSIGHAFGRTDIQGVPTRVVALSTQWLDIAQSLGVAPVGYIDNVAALAAVPQAPWEPAAIRDAHPIDPKANIAEQVARLQPDVILAPASVADKTLFDALARIAPTIPNLSSSQPDSWTDQLNVLGTVLDRESQAKSVEANITGRFDAILARNPTLRGKTFVSAFPAVPNQINVVADPRDGAAVVLAKLGMVLPPKLVHDAGPTGRFTVPPERVPELASDLLIVSAAEPGADVLRNAPGYAELPAVRKGAVAVLDPATGAGLSLPSPLSLPYVLDRLEAALAAAAT